LNGTGYSVKQIYQGLGRKKSSNPEGSLKKKSVKKPWKSSVIAYPRFYGGKKA